MRIITTRRLAEFGLRFADARPALDDWAAKASAARWRSLDDTRKVFAHADEVKVGNGRKVTVFNIKGNRYRLAAAIHYNRGVVYVLRFLKHAEYDKDAWKDQL